MKPRLLVVLVMSAVSTQLVPALASFPGANGRIAYYDFLERPSQIYTTEPDGTGVVQLTVGTRGKIDPAWSADGSMIAFASFSTRRIDRGRLEIMDADGGGRSTVVAYDGDRQIIEPAWSPTGAQIAFCVFARVGPRIWVVNVDGTALTRLSGQGQNDCNPDWSPDGTSIVFSSASLEDGLYVMDSDGTNRSLLTRGDADAPSWSPDGSKIAFARQLRSGKNEVFVVDADGTDRTRLTFSETRWEFTPAWSPDGSSIAFCRGTGPGALAPCQIWIMNADGSNPTKVTSTPDVDEFQLNWQPI